MRNRDQAEEKKQWNVAAWDLLYLVQCGVNSIIPDPERIVEMDLAKVYVRSKKQSLEAIAYMALESLLKSNESISIPDPNQVLEKWKEAKNKAIARNLMMDAAREELFDDLEKQGIWHVALKGIVLCPMYPKYGMRQMSDNDILFDPAFQQEVHDWFIEHGYEVESFQETHHDVYQKRPVYNFEMHTALFREIEEPQLTQYYYNIKDRLVPQAGKSFEYVMTDEDFYLYFLAHAYKHYSYKGTGLRFLVDLYVYHQAKGNLDWGYLNTELQKTGLFIFEQEARELSKKVFGPQWDTCILTKREKAMLDCLLFSDTYGARNAFWRDHLKNAQHTGKKVSITVKTRYLMCRLFPEQGYMEAWCQRRAPYFLWHRRLMPLAVFWRIIKSGITNSEEIKEELDQVKKA